MAKAIAIRDQSPWFYEYVDEVLARKDIQLDGVIIPIRDLTEASTSRAVVELQNAHQGLPFLADELKAWETHAPPGGVIFSLNPIDQARLLAVGFPKLIHALVQAEVPFI